MIRTYILVYTDFKFEKPRLVAAQLGTTKSPLAFGPYKLDLFDLKFEKPRLVVASPETMIHRVSQNFALLTFP